MLATSLKTVWARKLRLLMSTFAIVLGVAFVLEGISFTQAFRQTRRNADRVRRRHLAYVLNTSNPTLRAVFFEDSAALIGLDDGAAQGRHRQRAHRRQGRTRERAGNGGGVVDGHVHA